MEAARVGFLMSSRMSLDQKALTPLLLLLLIALTLFSWGHFFFHMKPYLGLPYLAGKTDESRVALAGKVGCWRAQILTPFLPVFPLWAAPRLWGILGPGEAQLGNYFKARSLHGSHVEL